jgi:hypothetical protein
MRSASGFLSLLTLLQKRCGLNTLDAAFKLGQKANVGGNKFI